MELDKQNAISKHTKGITYLIERSFQELFLMHIEGKDGEWLYWQTVTLCINNWYMTSILHWGVLPYSRY